MAGTRVRYRFGPLERRGLIAGWRGGQIAVVAAGAILAIAVLHRHPTLPTIGIAVAVVALCVAVAWWPIGARTAEQWLPTVARWGAAGLTGGRRRRARVEVAGHCIGPDGAPCLVASGELTGQGGNGGHGPVAGVAGPAGRERRAPPMARAPHAPQGVFAGLRVLGFDAREGAEALAVVHDQRARTYTSVMELLGHSFALLSGDEKERRVASWATVLSSLARERSIVHRVQWVAATMPDDGAAVDGHLASRGVLPEDAPARRSYAALLRSAGRETCRHDVHLAVQLRAAGATARAMRALGGGDRAACALLGREVAALRRQLAAADVAVEGALDERALAALVRRTVDAEVRNSRGCPPCGVGWPWPLVTECEWGSLRADGSWHATYWVAEWPRVDVGPEFLGPLLLGSVRRRVSVVMQPLSPARAVRQAERARTADIADAELRRRGGFLATARRAREAELALHREEELADGHASFRFSGYVSVSAPSQEQLTAACDSTEQAAAQCRLELRRLYGDQEHAFTCTLPLGRGLG
ncbi:MAG TPA: SCO6880 family protein [Acidimicrobiales bacterium]|nr:SCO6880 family protein [Acidimicrobiales bacterium]